MTLDDIKKHFGNSMQFERSTKMNHSCYTKWQNKGYIPVLTQRRIEELTGGKLKADTNRCAR